MHWWLFIAVMNTGWFAILGIEQHGHSISTPVGAIIPFETFSCVMLARRPMPPEERDGDWMVCCYECRPSPTFKLFAMTNLGAVLLGVVAATRLGADNEVLVFYTATPVAIFIWWYALGVLAGRIRLRASSG